MKVAVVGCGAVGSFYGAKLGRAGHELHFLLRSDYEAVRRDGVRIRSPQGDFSVRPHCSRIPETIGPSELVLIGLKTTANAELPRLLPPLVDRRTAVVTLQNGLGNEEQIARLLPADQILGGLCFVCLNRLEPGLIHHIDHGLVVLGEFGRAGGERTAELASMFREAGVPCETTENLAKAHWEKLTWNIPFNGLGVAGVAGYENLAAPAGTPLQPVTPGHTLTTDVLLADARWTTLLSELLLEVVAAARGLRFEMCDSLLQRQLERTRTMGPYKASTLLDFERGQPLELDSLFFEPLRQARDAGVPTPRLKRVCEVLRYLESRRSAATD